MEKVLKNIELIRTERGIKQEVMGKQLGVTQAAYSNYVNRNNDISLSRLTQIANILGVSVVDIITYPVKYVPENDTKPECLECKKKQEIIDYLTELLRIYKNKKV